MKNLYLFCLVLAGCATQRGNEGSAHGLSIFARTDHAAGAQKVGKALRPTELLIFGNSQGGTPLIECAQRVGIDLPLKALAWQDATGTVWLSYNEPRYLVHRHRAGECQLAVNNVAGALDALAAFFSR